MNVYKRHPKGHYWYRFTYKTKCIRRSSGVKNEEDAKDIAAAYRTQLAKGEVGIDPPKEVEPVPTFRQAMKGFLDWSEIEYSGHPRTWKRYQTSSVALLKFFGDKPIDRITRELCEKFKVQRRLQHKRPQGKKRKKGRVKATSQLRPATVNRELACLKHLFQQNSNIIPVNPCKGVKMLDEDNLQTRVLTVEEEKLYLLAASKPLQDIAALMIETGARPEEICRIRRENVHIDEGYIFNPYGKTKAARRKLWLNETASPIIANRLATIKGEYLFPGRVEGQPIVKVNAAHNSAVKRSGVRWFTLYACRHTFATRKVQEGVDLVTLAALLGHSRLEMVMRYAHPTEDHQREAMLGSQRVRMSK